MSRKNDLFEFELGEMLALSVVRYNGRDNEAVNAALGIVKKELLDQFQIGFELRFGGSLLKGTYVEGLSDVDALIVFTKPGEVRLTPADVRADAVACLRARFGRSVVEDGVLALTLDLPSIELQLLPALEQNGVLKIGSNDGRSWSTIQPQLFVEELSRVDKLMNGRLVPTIKLAKVMIAKLPKQRRLQGYHIEVLAISIFTKYVGRKELKSMLRFFFEKLPPLIMLSCKDVTGQSEHLDAYLGDVHSSRRRACSDAVRRIAVRIHNADHAESIELWRSLLATVG